MSQTSTIRINSTPPIDCTDEGNRQIRLEQGDVDVSVVYFDESHTEAVCAAIMAKAKLIRGRRA